MRFLREAMAAGSSGRGARNAGVLLWTTGAKVASFASAAFAASVPGASFTTISYAVRASAGLPPVSYPLPSIKCAVTSISGATAAGVFP